MVRNEKTGLRHLAGGSNFSIENAQNVTATLMQPMRACLDEGLVPAKSDPEDVEHRNQDQLPREPGHSGNDP